MRILYITHLTEQNGATNALRNIMEGMVEREMEVGLVVPSTEGYICDEARRLGVKLLHNFPYPWAMIKGEVSVKMWLLSQWKTYQLIKEFKPDIVHCNTGIIDYSLLGCLLTRTPMVWHAREYIDKDFGLKISGGMPLHRAVMKLPFVHCVSITKGIFKHFSLNSLKDIVIYDGVIDTSNDKKIEITTSNKRYFLYVGTFTEGKGCHVIFEQFGKFHKSYPDVELWLACRYNTDSSYYKMCMTHAVEGRFADNVKFLGFRTDVYELMQGAIAIIVPSRFEGFGFITAEAMYNNCLVIGRNTAGTKEQFDKGLEETGEEIGLRFENDMELAMLMEQAVKEDFLSIKRRAKEVVVENYTTDNNCSKLYEFYNKYAI